MSDDLMRQIQESLDAAYKRGFDEGWYDGNAAAWSSMAEWATECLANLKAPKPSPQDEAEDDGAEQVLEEMSAFDEPAQAAVAGRRLTPGEQRALDYVTENKGLTSNQIPGIGKGILYGLARAGVLAKIDGRFYPAEQA